VAPIRITNALNNLLPALYAAGSGEGEWETFLTMLGGATNSPKSHITYGNNIPRFEGYSSENATRQWIKSVGITEELLAYAGKPGNADEWWRQCVYGPYPEGWVGRGSELWPVEKMVRSELYRTVCLKCDFVWLAVAILFKSPGEMAVCGLARGKKDSDFEDYVIDLLRELAPHMRIVIRLYNKFGALQQNLETLELALEQFAAGVLVVDNTSTIIFANSSAWHLLNSQEGLVSEGGKLKTSSAHDLKQLQSCIDSAIQISERAFDGRSQDRPVGVASVSHKNNPALHAFVTPWLSERHLALNKPAAVVL
jgi:PAS domain-containing protein